MFSRHTMKAVSSKARRSHLYYLLIWNLPVRRASKTETGWDALGVLMVIGLLAGMVVLMRFLLTH
jgi:hypothetical protein